MTRTSKATRQSNKRGWNADPTLPDIDSDSDNDRQLLSSEEMKQEKAATFLGPFGADLHDAVLDASNAYPKVFVQAYTWNNVTRIGLLLWPTRYTAPLGVISPHAGMLFCLNGAFPVKAYHPLPYGPQCLHAQHTYAYCHSGGS
jgi:hypothetical protein